MQNRAIMTVRRLIIAMLMMLLAQAHHAWAQDSAQSSEYLIKAGYIYNFAKLVEWPASAFAQPDSPIVIGIVGTDPFGPIIDKVLEGKKVNGHSFVIKRLKPTADVKECHILFVGTSLGPHVADTIRLTRGTPILTISEIPGFADRGGIINLTLEQNKVRFEVNVDAAKQADLNISSRLLVLAKVIQQPGDGRKTE
ncbi:MAG TPA: YfiR family protein [Terriglobales bacterium]|nr:YfiR family protein [Terriglobales bacterium]